MTEIQSACMVAADAREAGHPDAVTLSRTAYEAIRAWFDARPMVDVLRGLGFLDDWIVLRAWQFGRMWRAYARSEGISLQRTSLLWPNGGDRPPRG